MRKKKVVANIIIVFIAAVYVLLITIGNVGRISIKMATVPGSFADTYAKENKIQEVNLSDTQKDYFDQRVETFEYNVNQDGSISLEQYKGKSENLVIPAYIDSRVVSIIGENFFSALNTNVTKVYISDTLKVIDSEPAKQITIVASKQQIEALFSPEDEWNTEELRDSSYINFNLGDNLFDYNYFESGIDITGYKGENSELIVIPSYIDGVPVKTISMNLLANASIYVVPETVNEITGKTGTYVYSNNFVAQLIFTIIAFLISLICTNIVSTKIAKKESKILYGGTQVIVLFVYLIVQVIWGIVCLKVSFVSFMTSIVASSVILAVFFISYFLVEIGSDHSAISSKERDENTEFMQGIRKEAGSILVMSEGTQAYDKVKKLYDETRYSTLVGDSKNDKDIQEKMENLRKSMEDKNFDEIDTIINELILLIKGR